jgi:hypothetical protein
VISDSNQKEGRIREIQLEAILPPSVDAGPPAKMEETPVFFRSFEYKVVHQEGLSDLERRGRAGMLAKMDDNWLINRVIPATSNHVRREERQTRIYRTDLHRIVRRLRVMFPETNELTFCRIRTPHPALPGLGLTPPSVVIVTILSS